jgi:hypothetical protein
VSILGPSWLTFAGSVALAFALGGTGGFFKGMSYQKDKQAVALAKATEAARDVEAKWQTNLEAQNELDQEARARMSADYDRRIADSMRNRTASRLPAAAASSCAGASPAQLSGPDAAAFDRLARDARAVQLDLEKARGWIEEVTGAKP